MGSYFSLAVKALYFGAAYLFIVILLDMQFPGILPDTAFSVLGILSLFILFIIDFIFDYT